MANIHGDSVLDDGARNAAVQHFFTSTSWIEGSATRQLADIAALPGMISVAGFPDLHPGEMVRSRRTHRLEQDAQASGCGFETSGGPQPVCRDERSQHRNKAGAIRRLQTILHLIAERRQAEDKTALFLASEELERGNAAKTFRLDGGMRA